MAFRYDEIPPHLLEPVEGLSKEQYYHVLHNYFINSDSDYIKAVQAYVQAGKKPVQTARTCSPPAPRPHDISYAPARARSTADALRDAHRPRRTPTRDANRTPEARALVDKVEQSSAAYERSLRERTNTRDGGMYEAPRMVREGAVGGTLARQDIILDGRDRCLQKAAAGGETRPRMAREKSAHYVDDAGIYQIVRPRNENGCDPRTESLQRSHRVQNRSLQQVRTSPAPVPSTDRQPSRSTRYQEVPMDGRCSGRGGKFYEDLNSPLGGHTGPPHRVSAPRQPPQGPPTHSNYISHPREHLTVPQRNRLTVTLSTLPARHTNRPPPNPANSIYRLGVQINYIDDSTHGPFFPHAPEAKPTRGILKARSVYGPLKIKPGRPYAYAMMFNTDIDDDEEEDEEEAERRAALRARARSRKQEDYFGDYERVRSARKTKKDKTKKKQSSWAKAWVWNVA